MDDFTTLTFYRLCWSCDIDGLMNTFGDVFDSSSVAMDYAYFMVYTRKYRVQQPANCEPILTWLLKIDEDINVGRIENDYTADEHIPNDALLLACELGHAEVIKWLFTEESYLASFKNRCYICRIFEISCCYSNLGITKIIFEKLADYISVRILILNQAYRNAIHHQNTQTAEWLLQINPTIDITEDN
jgi:hypothetical protein